MRSTNMKALYIKVVPYLYTSIIPQNFYFVKSDDTFFLIFFENFYFIVSRVPINHPTIRNSGGSWLSCSCAII